VSRFIFDHESPLLATQGVDVRPALSLDSHVALDGGALPADDETEPRSRSVEVGAPFVPPSFDAVYGEHFAFVFRTLRRLGVPESHVEDAVQEAFVVVHRRLAEFEGRASIKTWLFRIVWRIAQDHRRDARKGRGEVDPDTLAADTAAPNERSEAEQARRVLAEILEEMDEDKRVVFVLAELEQLSLREIAAALSENVNTVTSRLRAARQAFDRAVHRRRAQEEWRLG
jgi:RNA polymerase sigma-70 factor (ECF subfamily)